MHTLCGCFSKRDSNQSAKPPPTRARLIWPWNRPADVKPAQDTPSVEPTLAKQEEDDQGSRPSIPRTPVTFELSPPEEPSTEMGCTQRNRSLDIEPGHSLLSRKMESKTNRTYPTIYGSRNVTRNSTRLTAGHGHQNSLRRGSILTRTGSRRHESMKAMDSVGEGTSPSTVERFLDDSTIVTPFAQILAGLRSVKDNIEFLTSPAQLSS